jgi:acyl-CoA thioester hydrolase
VKSFSKDIIVVSSDLDELNHVNNIRYLEWVQDISKEHWTALSDNQFTNRFFWVVRSHNITYFRPALINDLVTINTFVSELKGPISKRIVEIYSKQPDNKVARCETDWILMEYRTGKPCRIPSEIMDLFGF